MNQNISRNASNKYVIQESVKPTVVAHDDIEKIMAFIGSINWEQEGIHNGFHLSEDHPFYFLYQSIKLIKRGNEKILFIDNEASIVNMTSQMLMRLGYTVEAKINPVEALVLFQANPEQFDLVITDMTMPQITGIKLSEQLKKVRADIPVIVCTGYSTLLDEEKAKAIGIKGFLMKPVAKFELAQIVRKVLDEAKRPVKNNFHIQ